MELVKEGETFAVGEIIYRVERVRERDHKITIRPVGQIVRRHENPRSVRHTEEAQAETG